MLPEGKRPFGSTVIAQRGQESMRKRQRGTRPVSDEPLSAGRVEYLEQARERVRNRRIRRTALIVVALTLVVLFQPEIRRALERMGQTDQWAGKLFNIKGRYNDPSFKGAWRSAIIAICDAAERFSETKTGALIVLERNTNLSEIVRTGTPVNSAVNLEVLGTIFYEGTPLHDGAAIIENGRIKAAGCVLPLSNNLDLGKDMGTRHRACLGIAENSDAIAVVVSEETGIISMAKNGVLIRHFDRQTLYTRLVDEMIPKETASEKAAADGWRGKVKSLLNWMNQKEEDEQQ